MKIKNIILLTILSIICGCATTNTSPTRSEKITEKIKGGYFEWIPKQGLTRLEKLKLMEDSTFVYFTSTEEFHGNWNVSQDGTYLNIEGKGNSGLFNPPRTIKYEFKIKNKDKLILPQSDMVFKRVE